MKKILALILVLLMVFSMSACASDSDNDDEDDEEHDSMGSHFFGADYEDDEERQSGGIPENVKEGDIIAFGHYEQDGDTSNGKEEIEWLVLTVDDSKALVISKYALHCGQYHNGGDTTWEDCTIRRWLNEGFMDSAFSGKEQDMILTTRVKNEDNEHFGTDGGADTEDQIFLLSIDEAEEYFATNADRQCEPTQYVIDQGVDMSDEYSTCIWWLRTPGLYQSLAAYIAREGGVGGRGISGNFRYHAIRPAFWINLNA